MPDIARNSFTLLGQPALPPSEEERGGAVSYPRYRSLQTGDSAVVACTRAPA